MESLRNAWMFFSGKVSLETVITEERETRTEYTDVTIMIFRQIP